MTIIIKPHGIHADVEVSTPAEAAAVLVGLKTPGQILLDALLRDVRPAEEAARKHPGWSGIFHEDPAPASVPSSSGLATEETATTAVGSAPGEVSAPRNRRWSRAEVSDLHVWVRDGVSVAEIGERLGRSPSSVRHKIAAIEKDRAGKRLAPMRQKKVTA